MMASEFLAVLNRIAATGSRSDKEDLLREAMSDPLASRALQYAYDPHITFGIVPRSNLASGSKDFDADTVGVWHILDGLRMRQITGGRADDVVSDMFALLSPDAGELLWRIMVKDMRCGITEKTVNLVRPGTIPTFDVMLAHKFEPKRVKAWPVIVEPKLDGVRVVCLVKDGVARFYSRTGKLFPAVEHLGPRVVELVDTARSYVQNGPSDETPERAKVRKGVWDYLGGDAGAAVALDGEIVSGSFNKTVGDVRRSTEAAVDAEYVIFDVLPLAEFLTHGAMIMEPFTRRRTILTILAPEAGMVRRGELAYAKSVDEVQELYQSYRDRGLEGAIVKPVDDFYSKKRSYAWLKMKNEETEDLRIIGWYEGEEGTRLEGKFGGYIVDRAGVEVNVGGGFSDVQREENLAVCIAEPSDDTYVENGKIKRKFKAPGRLIEVEFHEATPDGSLRHPRFTRYRDDKDPLQAAA